VCKVTKELGVLMLGVGSFLAQNGIKKVKQHRLTPDNCYLTPNFFVLLQMMKPSTVTE
jgi:hypothetical protein